jgi:hypothetical protein
MTTNHSERETRYYARLMSIARDSGVSVHYLDAAAFPGIDWDGLYLVTPDFGAGIALRGDLSPEWRDWVLAHELGHHFGHLNALLFSPFGAHVVDSIARARWAQSKRLDPDEEIANKWAVTTLVSDGDWDMAERIAPCDLHRVVNHLGLPLPAAIAWEREHRHNLHGETINVPLCQAANEILARPLTGQGGHQSFFRRLNRQRKGTTQIVSYREFSYARERAAQVQGGWFSRYQALLDAIAPMLESTGTSRQLFRLRPKGR